MRGAGRGVRATRIDVRTGVKIERVDHDGDSTCGVDGEDLDADQLLVAAGRRPNLADIGLETVGLDPAANASSIDEQMRAGERLWAVGDITGKGAFTHVSMYQDAVAVARHARRGRAVGRLPRGQPGDVHRPRGRPRSGSPSTRPASRARRPGRAGEAPEVEPGLDPQAGQRGLIKLVADADRGVLVGGTVVAPSGGEVLGLIAAAVHAEIPWRRCGPCTSPTRRSTGRSRRRWRLGTEST